MKTLIVAVNSKYIHTSLAVRLLYLSACRKHDVSFTEYTIKMEEQEIAEDILLRGPEIAAFSCYIWNISHIRRICTILKERKPELVILLGGPEVTYDPAFYLESVECDYILQGEGEEIFPALLETLECGESIRIPGISSRDAISDVAAECDLSGYQLSESPYCLSESTLNDADGNMITANQSSGRDRILYFESGRGCPFHCQYCLSSLEKGIRFFPDEWLWEQLEIVCKSPARIIKFLDRSFCANAAHAIKVLEYIFEHYSEGQQYQIEVNADSMPAEVVDLIVEKAPQGLLRLEVGIQSTCEESNRAVGRMQNYDRLAATVRMLQNSGKCDLHLDLIAGLPYESLDRFRESFDAVFALDPLELQLGFLKLLRGTGLRRRAEEFGYVYREEPPYEILKSRWMSEEDLGRIHQAEDMLEKYYNSYRFSGILSEILKDYSSAFDFFMELGEFYQDSGFPKIGYHLQDLFLCLDRFTNGKYRKELIEKYYGLHKRRPPKWWESTISGAHKKEVTRMLAREYGFPENELFHYGQLEEFEDEFLIVIYRNNCCDIHRIMK